MFLGCCYGHEERPCDADVVLEHVLKAEGGGGGGGRKWWDIA